MRTDQAKRIQIAVNRLISNPESKSTCIDNAIIMKQGKDIIIKLKDIL